MKRPFRETNESNIDVDYAEFMRRMYAEEAEIKRPGITSLILLCAGIAVCIAVIIFQLN